MQNKSKWLTIFFSFVPGAGHPQPGIDAVAALRGDQAAVLGMAEPRGDVDHLAEREQRDGQHDDADPVEELQDAEGEALRSAHLVDADGGHRQPDGQCGETADRGVGDHGGGGDDAPPSDRAAL